MPARVAPIRGPGGAWRRAAGGGDPAAACLSMLRDGLCGLIEAQAEFGHAVLGLLTPGCAPEGAAAPGPVAAAAATPCRETFILNRPGDATLELRMGAPADTMRLSVPALHPLQPGPPSITQVAFLPPVRAGEVRLSITWPEGQPAGTYFGAVLDGAAPEPVGTLTLRVSQAGRGRT